jgi:hypothetical protein
VAEEAVVAAEEAGAVVEERRPAVAPAAVLHDRHTMRRRPFR